MENINKSSSKMGLNDFVDHLGLMVSPLFLIRSIIVQLKLRMLFYIDSAWLLWLIKIHVVIVFIGL